MPSGRVCWGGAGRRGRPARGGWIWKRAAPFWKAKSAAQAVWSRLNWVRVKMKPKGMRLARTAGQAGGHGLEGAGEVAHGVVGVGGAVEADGEQVGEADEGVEVAGVEEHAVGGDGGAHAAGVGLTEELGERLVEGGFTAGEAGDEEALRACICDRTLEDCDGELIPLIGPGGRSNSAGIAGYSAGWDGSAGWGRG